MKKKKVILLALIILVVAVLAASVCFNIFWCDRVYKSFLAMGGYESLHYEQSAHIAGLATEELKYFYGFLAFVIIQFFALLGTIFVLIYTIKTDFTLSKQEREARDAARQEERKQAKKAKLQAQLDELNK